jgi:hypothetical protein
VSVTVGAVIEIVETKGEDSPIMMVEAARVCGLERRKGSARTEPL